ncbi:MAG: hypothetical protein V2I57_16355 [Xanthomonadales bacterium]|jgi:hypothetical protein|nr:hypothetical protein [Xanthomonadales bacterium]
MNDKDRKLLRNIRDDLRETLRTSERSRTPVTDHEKLEDISFQLARTLHTLEHRIQACELR